MMWVTVLSKIPIKPRLSKYRPNAAHFAHCGLDFDNRNYNTIIHASPSESLRARTDIMVVGSD